MEFLCYLHESWRPHIRPAPQRRPWMDETPSAFATRCLPLNIANAYGWEILTPSGFSALWTGGSAPSDVLITPDPGTQPEHAPVALFGSGVLTFHVQGIFRTPPGWNLWVGPSANTAKDGIAALSGIIETDWSPYSWTANWRFMRRNRRIRFEAGEPFCCIHPIQRGVLEQFEPRFVPLADNPDLQRQFAEWGRSRDAFQADVAKNPPRAPKDQWQQRYYRGLDMDDAKADGHQAKLRLKPFRNSRDP